MSPFLWMFIKTYEKLRDYIISVKDITTLVNEIEKLLSTTLSPLRYSKILPVIKDNTALRKNLENIIYMVNDWCETMAETIGVTTNKNIIDMEELN